jgi:hypothetical protein
LQFIFYLTYHIVQANGPPFKQNLSRPARIDGKPEFNNKQTNVFIEAVQNQFAHPVVIPSSMHQQQLQQEPELKPYMQGTITLFKSTEAIIPTCLRKAICFLDST